jgi:hypothetical protein
MKSLWLALSLAACTSAASVGNEPPTVVNVARPSVPARVVANPVRVEWMLRGYFRAGAQVSKGLGGNATSNNMPRELATLTGVQPGSKVQIVALPDDAKPWHRYDGYRVVIVNPTDKPVGFDAQDSRLGVVHEAIDPTGTWAPIEYLPSSWCGNSYHELELPARSYWELAAPHYDGPFATRLRLKLTVNDHTMYSNEFEGRIDPKQFAEKQGHAPANVMDPYLD